MGAKDKIIIVPVIEITPMPENSSGNKAGSDNSGSSSGTIIVATPAASASGAAIPEASAITAAAEAAVTPAAIGAGITVTVVAPGSEAITTGTKTITTAPEKPAEKSTQTEDRKKTAGEQEVQR